MRGEDAPKKNVNICLSLMMMWFCQSHRVENNVWWGKLGQGDDEDGNDDDDDDNNNDDDDDDGDDVDDNDGDTYLIFVIFFTQAKFLENKIYTEKRQFFALNL